MPDFPWPDDEVERYTAYRTEDDITVDGELDEEAWKRVPQSPRFVDLVDGEPGIHDTRAAVLWDDEYLYVGFWVEEPQVEASLTERDAPIYEDNDVELFVAGPDAYYEFEINAFGTIYEVFFVWEDAYEAKGYDEVPAFDTDAEDVRPFDGVGYDHPRGDRIGFWNWDFPGLQSAVSVDGSINDDDTRDRGWTVELALPWAGMEPLFRGEDRALPPTDGDVWRMDFSRFNQYTEAEPADDPGGWAWSAHGAWDSHIPEVFPYVTFDDRDVSDVTDDPDGERGPGPRR
jgi:hypothetical protein